MKTLFLITLLISSALFSQWKEVESLKFHSSLSGVTIHNGNIYGYFRSEFYVSYDNGSTFDKIQSNLSDFEDFGEIKEFLIHNNIFYFVSDSDLEHNIFRNLYKSTDYGKNWSKLTNNDHYYENLKIIDNVFYIYTSHKDYTGIIFSEDFGESWNQFETEENFDSYRLILKDENNIILTHTTADNNRYDGKGILISSDNGKNWVNKNQGLNGNGITGIIKLGDNLIVSTRSGVYKSTNYGDIWRPCNIDLPPAALWVRNISQANNDIYITTRNGLYVSYDTANTWQLANPLFEGYESNFFNYSEDTYIFSGSKDFSYSFKSKDKFKTLDTLNFKSGEFYVNYFNLDEINYISTRYGLYIHHKLENTFEVISDFFNDYSYFVWHLQIRENFMIAQIGHNADSYGFNELIISMDKGNTWQIIDLNKPNKVKINGIYINEENTIYILSPNYHILYSNDLGLTWEDLVLPNDVSSKLTRYTGGFYIENDSIYIRTLGSILKTDTKFSFFEEIIDPQDEVYLNQMSYRNVNQMTKYKNFISVFLSPGNVVLFSYDFGKSWQLSNQSFGFSRFNQIISDMIQIENNLFIATSFGIYLSKDFGETWTTLNENISNYELAWSKKFFHINDKIYLTTNLGFYAIDLEELGIKLSVETRNALYHYPPFPQPSSTSVRIKTLWDSSLPFKVEDIEIYNLNGEKIDTKGKLTIEKEANNIGIINWDNSGNEPGTYIIKTTHGTATRITKVMVLR